MVGGRHQVALLPAEEFQEDSAQIRDPKGRVVLLLRVEQGAELPLTVGDIAVRHDPGLDHHTRRQHETLRLHEAQPLLVGKEQPASIVVGHGYPVRGQR